MARPNLTQDELDSFREHAATIALAMVEEDGVEALTLRALAARLGCSYAKPYRYFRDKAHLVDAVRGRAFDLLRETIGADLAAYDPTSPRPLATLYVRFALEHREVYRVLFEMNQELISDRTRAAQARAWEVCSRPFHDAVADGTLVGDPELIAHVAWTALHGLASLKLAGQLYLGKDVDEIAIGLDVVVDGFRPGRTSRA